MGTIRTEGKYGSMGKERMIGMEQRVEQATVREVPGRYARRGKGRTGMRILFLTSAHNSMSQRAYVELTRLGHEVSVGMATSEKAMFEAVERHSPELIVAPMLRRAIPEGIWREHVCIIVHPGPKGDRGPSSLDWAILEGHERWGVTLLQANAEMDAGDIWASHTFQMRAGASKNSIYKEEVIEAAMRGLLEVVDRFEDGNFIPEPLDYGRPDVVGRLHPLMKQEDRRIDWSGPTEGVLRKLRSADGSPGVHDEIGGLGVFLYGGYEEDRLRGEPGALIATRDGAVCRATGDGAVWIPSLKRAGDGHFKLPATMVLGPERLAVAPDMPLAPHVPSPGRTYRQIRYEEIGEVGYLHFAFPGGAMSTVQCRRLHDALLYARSRPTRVLVFMGGPDYFSNGIHLNVIEAAESPADESWRNINAIDDLVHDIITIEDKLTVSALRANAGAGGVTLATAADLLWTRPNVVLNPHYKGMGGLYGSEYWTYLLPRRVGEHKALELTEGTLPLGAYAAREMGLVDDVLQGSPATFRERVTVQAEALARDQSYWMMLAIKEALRRHDERRKPLAQYREEELARMRENFYGPNPSYHEARRRFVHKLAPDHEEPREEAHNIWRKHLILDCLACERRVVRDADAIREFCEDLVQSVGMVAYGKPVVEHFATRLPGASGYSLVQLMETSAVTGRFCDASGDVYIDVFSCGDFDPEIAIEMVERHFGPRSIVRTDLIRDASPDAGEAAA